MPCFSPLEGWRSIERTKLGKRKIVFDARQGFRDRHVTVSCGKCIGCRLERSRQWAVRCVHEASLWEKNCFVTLTYRVAPEGNSLDPRDFVLFMKRLRKAKGNGIRFLQCGQYGSLGRPHHHCLLFNCDFPDGEAFEKSPSGESLFRSGELERIWPHGFSSFGKVTFESASYVARYTISRLGESELGGRHPEYLSMSRGGRTGKGIGAGWIEKFKSDVYPSDELVLRGGKVMRPPRFYDNQVEVSDPDLVSMARSKRGKNIDPKEGGSSRLIQRQVNVQRRVDDFLKRTI